jgi:hypothetical protein
MECSSDSSINEQTDPTPSVGVALIISPKFLDAFTCEFVREVKALPGNV